MRFGCCGSMISPAADPIGVEVVESLARVGYDYVELSLADMAALSRSEFHALRLRVERSGIPCEACNNFFPRHVRLTGPDVRLDEAVDYAANAIASAQELGAKVIVFGSSAAKNVPPGFPHDQAWRQIVELLKRVGPVALSHDITIAIEPLNRLESNIVNLASEGMELVRQVDHPNVQLLFDFYHLVKEAEDPSVIERAAPMIRHAHVAKVEGRVFPVAAEPDLADFLARLRHASYDGRCSVEAYTRDFESDAGKAIAVLKELTR